VRKVIDFNSNGFPMRIYRLDGFMRVAKENGIMGSFIVAFNMYVKATINQKWQPCNLAFNFVTCSAGCVKLDLHFFVSIKRKRKKAE